ncbi:exosome complex exonuclease Rrp41 [Candidatus Woesearchaeota archaeon]|nr:exosome complex exonuclease Rrp41 [Candidatus Woesearchaeota archaeon]
MAFKRSDGRKEDEPRPMEAKAGIIKRADGSAMFKIGNTTAYAAVYGPRNLFPKFLQNPRQGIIRVNYSMMPFSSAGERVRPGPSRRSKEISMVLEKAILPVVNLEEFPNAVVDVFISLPQTDAGTRCAGLCAASIALADAGIPMKDMVAAISAGKYDDNIILDLNYEEDSYEHGCDIPIAMIQRSGEISLMQMDGEITKEQLLKAIELAKKGLNKIYEVQKKALKEKYELFGEVENGDVQ